MSERATGRSIAASARTFSPVINLGLLLLIVAWFGSGGSPLLQQEVTMCLINVVLVVGLYVFVGNSGVLSFGQMAFMGIGAYASALVTIPVVQKSATLPDLPGFVATVELGPVPGAVVAGLFVALVALVVAVPFMRLNGIAAGIATFAGLIVVRTVLSNWDAITRGNQQMIVPITTDLTSALLWSLVALVIAFAFQQSRWGLRLRASRENLAGAKALGVGVLGERTMAFVLSALLVAIGGSLYGHLLGAFSPDAFYIDITFVTVAMLVVGGINSLSGAVIGAVVVSFISELLIRAEQGIDILGTRITTPGGLRDIALGLIILAILVLRPSGITGGKELRWPPGPWGGLWRRARPPAEATTPGEATAE